MQFFSKGYLSVIIAFSLLASSTAHAAAFYLSEVGTPASVGTAGASNVTNNFGPDATWANPAGLTAVDDGVIVAGFQVVTATMEFDASVAQAGGDDGGNAGSPAGIPSLFYHRQLSERWHAGVGVSGMMGGGMDYGNNFAGRYGAKEVTLQGLGATFSLGWQATDKLSLGAGLSVVYTLFEEEIAVNQPGALPDGAVKFDELDDVGVQPILGMQYQATDDLLLGLSWRGELDADLEGDLRFSNVVLPLPAETDVGLDWTNPQWLEIGGRYTLPSGHQLMLSANWQEWSKFSKNQLSVNVDATGNVIQTTLDRDWDDTWGVALALASPWQPEVDAWAWSVGIGYDSSPVEDDVRTIDLPMDETWKLAGAIIRSRAEKFDWSLSLSAQMIGDAEVDQTSQGVRFVGDFDKYYVVFLGATARF